MRDIAEKAGVSPSTVSLALSDHPRIPEKTRRHIREVAEALGYQGVRSQPQVGPTVGLFLAGPTGATLIHQALEGILSETTAARSPLVLIDLNKERFESADELLRTLERSNVKGAVVLGSPISERIFGPLYDNGFPFICVGSRELKGREISWVASDYLNGAREGVQHLIDLGHRNIALATDLRYKNVMHRDRLLGYKVAMADAELPEGPQWFINTVDDAVAALERWKQDRQVTAVFTTNCRIAFWILGTCNMLQISVPDELAVVAFDDDLGAELLNPPLTTVRQPLTEIGATATRALLSWLRGTPRNVVQSRVRTQLVVRASCGGKTTHEPSETIADRN